jgi:hypothetical protein
MTIKGDMATVTAEALCFIKAFHDNIKEYDNGESSAIFKKMVLTDSNIWKDGDEPEVKKKEEPSLDEMLKEELEKLRENLSKLLEDEEDEKDD